MIIVSGCGVARGRKGQVLQSNISQKIVADIIWWHLYTATLIIAKAVFPVPFFNGINSSRNPDPVPAKAGNHYFRNTGFPRIEHGAGSVELGMTNRIRLMSSYI
jgi:hypothetical protein